MNLKLKYLYTLVAIIAAVIFCGFKYSNREGNEILCDGQQMEILHFHGHTYVCYRFYKQGNQSAYGSASIVHDPDCQCGKGGRR